jgi:hypothetical protein
MRTQTRTRVAIAASIYPMANVVIFGTGLVLMLTLYALRGEEAISIPTVVAASLTLPASAAWLIALRLRASHWRLRAARRSSATVRPRV